MTGRLNAAAADGRPNRRWPPLAVRRESPYSLSRALAFASPFTSFLPPAVASDVWRPILPCACRTSASSLRSGARPGPMDQIASNGLVGAELRVRPDKRPTPQSGWNRPSGGHLPQRAHWASPHGRSDHTPPPLCGFLLLQSSLHQGSRMKFSESANLPGQPRRPDRCANRDSLVQERLAKQDRCAARTLPHPGRESPPPNLRGQLVKSMASLELQRSRCYKS